MTSTSVRGSGSSRRSEDWSTPAVLLVLAAAGWWWSARMASDMAPDASGAMDAMAMDAMAMDREMLGGAAFLLAWLAMMTAMMLPAITPVVKLYRRAVAAGRVAPLPYFVAGYLVVWTMMGAPAYLAWKALMDPIADARPWTGRLAGVVMLAAAVWQLTPLKVACLRHCRSPLSFFVRFGSAVHRPLGALRMGTTHGLFCVGCCWALMATLVAVGTMNVAWMAAVSVLILVEKNAAAGERIATAAAVVFATAGLLLLIRPDSLVELT